MNPHGMQKDERIFFFQKIKTRPIRQTLCSEAEQVGNKPQCRNRSLIKILGLINDSLSTGLTGDNGHFKEKENKTCYSLAMFTEPSESEHHYTTRCWYRGYKL